jgi:glycine cleavage system H protein
MSKKSYEYREDCRYTESDEWVRFEDGVALVGVTDYAQSALSDVVYVELPSPGTQLAQGQNFGVVESVKAVAELYAPIAGEIVRVNGALEERPELVNEDPYEQGWIVALAPEDLDSIEQLMSAEQYRAHVEARTST